MEPLEPHADGVVLKVRALPGARQAGLRGIREGALRVAVTQIAERGKANKAVMRLLGKELRLRRSQLELLWGETSQDKGFLVRDVNQKDLAQKVAEALARLDSGG